MFGILIAGHDTSSSSLLWGLKHLSNNQSAQHRLRTEMRRALPQAAAEGRPPTITEIVALRLPYLDAVAEEIFRTALTMSAHVRTTTEDAPLLGYTISKGTNVFMAVNEPGFFSPPFPISERLRSETWKAGGGGHAVEDWDFVDFGEFRPERWLVRDDDHESDGKEEGEVVDPSQAPQMLFSLGPRSCDVDTSTGKWIGYQLLADIGYGLTIQAPVVVVQGISPPQDISMAGSIVILIQNLLGGIWVPVGQNIFGNQLMNTIRRLRPEIDPTMVVSTGATEIRRVFSAEDIPAVLEGFMQGLRGAFILGTACASVSVVILIVAFFIDYHVLTHGQPPRGRRPRVSSKCHRNSRPSCYCW